MVDYRAEFDRLYKGLDPNRYYDAWRLTLILWRSVWFASRVDWQKYRLDIWSKFSERLEVAARTTSSLSRFLSQVGRFLSLTSLGTNEEDRKEVIRMLALPEDQQDRLISLLRTEIPILVALVRRWREDNRGREEENAGGES